MYVLLRLSPFDLILNQILFLSCAQDTVVTFVPVVNNFKITITFVS